MDAAGSGQQLDRMLAASIVEHKAAVRALKWHLETDDSVSGNPGNDWSSWRTGGDDWRSTRDTRGDWQSTEDTKNDWRFSYNTRDDWRASGTDTPAARDVLLSKANGWSVSNGFAAPHRRTWDEAPSYDERKAGTRAYLERKLRAHVAKTASLQDIRSSSSQLPHLDRFHPSIGEDYEADDGFSPDMAEDCEPPRAAFGIRDDDIRTRYQYRQAGDPSRINADTSLDGPANWPHSCRPFFYRRADAPSVRYY